MFYILTQPNCSWCDKAKELLEKKGEGYKAFSHTEHVMLRKLMLSANMRTVPQVWCEGKHIGGYEDLVKWFDNQ